MGKNSGTGGRGWSNFIMGQPVNIFHIFRKKVGVRRKWTISFRLAMGRHYEIECCRENRIGGGVGLRDGAGWINGGLNLGGVAF